MTKLAQHCLHGIRLPVENVGLLGKDSGESDLYFVGSLVSNNTTEPSCYRKEQFHSENKQTNENSFTHPAKI